MRETNIRICHPTTPYLPIGAEPVLRRSHHEGMRDVYFSYHASYSIYSWQVLFLRIPQIVASMLDAFCSTQQQRQS